MTEKEILEAAKVAKMNKRKIYIGGHIMTRGARKDRLEEKEMCLRGGHEVFVPQEAPHNDKSANAETAYLCDTIVKVDQEALEWADTILIEPLHEAVGTVCELGIIHGRKMLAEQIMSLMCNQGTEPDPESICDQVWDLCQKVKDQQVIAHYGDLRRVEGITETGDFRSWGTNQFLYGVVRKLTNNEGFTDFEDIEGILNNGH